MKLLERKAKIITYMLVCWFLILQNIGSIQNSKWNVENVHFLFVCEYSNYLYICNTVNFWKRYQKT